MRVFVAGATGTLGRPVVRAMVAAGHEVRGVARSEASAAVLRALGAVPVAVADFFDAREMHDAVSGSEAIVHLATCIPPLARMRKRAAWRDNDRLRSQGSSILVNAALAHGIRIYIQPSVTLLYQDLGDTVLYETAPIDAAWPLGSARDAEREASRVTARGGEGVVLRLASLYGSEAPSTRALLRLARWRALPVPGSADRYVSSLHVDDAATAVAAALAVPAGIYNVADDEPMPVREYGATLAQALGAGTPHRIPVRLARLLLGPAGGILARSQRVANTMFRSVSGWMPVYASVRVGLPAVVAAVRDRPA